MITYRATLDVPASTLVRVSRWLTTHRKNHDTRPWQRAATAYVQAVMVLRGVAAVYSESSTPRGWSDNPVRAQARRRSKGRVLPAADRAFVPAGGAAPLDRRSIVATEDTEMSKTLLPPGTAPAG